MTLREGSSQASNPLPQGGGSQNSIGQDFEVDLASGSGSYHVAFEFPPGPRQDKPELSIGYSTGYGNGIMGLGWSLELSAISRDQVDGQPAFEDERDNFSYGGQRLVPVGGNQYRQGVEKEFYRIKRTGIGWEVRTKDGVLLRYGTTPEGQLKLPVDKPDPVLQWLLESSEDAIGNRIAYCYIQEGGHARLLEIRYGPYIVRLDYEIRPDAVISYRLGAERILRYRLSEVRLILVEDGFEQPVKAYRMKYEQAPFSCSSRLVSVVLVAFDAKTMPPGEDALPPLCFEYTDIDPDQTTLKPLRSKSGVMPPLLKETGLTLIDSDGSGLPGFLYLSERGGQYWPNLGNLQVGAPQQLKRFPSALADQSDNLRVASLSGHGLLDLVVLAGRTGGYYALQPGGNWEQFRYFKRAPPVELLNARTRFVDLDFDGQADILYADERAFYAIINRGGGDFDSPRVIRRLHDRARFPDVDLASRWIHLADMVGDGSSALVEVRDRSVIYWPNLGFGRFKDAVIMASPPNLPANYDTQKIFVTDVDGDGLADLVYVDLNRVICWFNQAGQSFSAPIVIMRTPLAISGSVILADILGRGSQGLLWSGAEPLSGRSTHYFLDLAGPKKANLLARITTSSGAEIRIDYGTSATEAIQDRKTSDAAYLPFPVQVVRRVEFIDRHTGETVISEFEYHKGYYERRQKRFLGFGRVVRRDIGGEDAPDRITVSYFYTRPPEKATIEVLHRYKILARMPYKIEVFGSDDGEITPFWTQNIEGEAVLVDVGLNGEQVYFAARRRIHRIVTDRSARSIEQETLFQYDPFGNVISETEIQHFRDGADVERITRRIITATYAEDGPSYLVGLPVRSVERSGEGGLLAACNIYYDGTPFLGLPLGKATRGVLARRETMAFTEDMLTKVYGANVPDMKALGYIHKNDPELGHGWWAIESAQKTDTLGNPVARRDPLGQEMNIEFDLFGIYPIKIINALGQSATVNYDYRNGQMIRQAAIDGSETNWVFDLHGRLLHIIRPQDADGQPSIAYERDLLHSPQSVTIKRRALKGEDQSEIQHIYLNARGEHLQTRVELGEGRVLVGKTPVAFCRGLATIEREPYFSSDRSYSIDDVPEDVPFAHIKRDALDRPLEISASNGNHEWKRYEAGVIHHFDAADSDLSSTCFDTPRSEYFDASGRLMSVIERLDRDTQWCTQYQRNEAGLLTGAADHTGRRFFTQYYDLMGRLVRLDHKDSGDRVYLLDAAGNRIEERRGIQRLYREFDPLGRITSLRFGAIDSALVETYKYDEGAGDHLIGRLARVVGTFGSVEYSYTCCGRMKSKKRTFPDRPGEAFTISYAYDLLGRPKSVTYPNGYVVNLGYDAIGRPIGVSGVINGVEYDPSGNPTRIVYANGIETEYTYSDKPGRLKTMRTGIPGGDSYQHFKYNYDNVGNPIEIEDLTTVPGHALDNRNYRYDALYRLVESNGSDAEGTYHHLYSYDSLGNLITRPEVNGGLSLTYNDGRVMRSSSGEEFAYDDLGNLKSLDGWTHGYDPRGRLIESTRSEGYRSITCSDHTGARVSTKVECPGGVVKRTWYCDDAYIINDDESTEIYIFFNRHRVAVLRSDGPGHVIHADPLGNPTCFSSLSDGSFEGQTIYYPYGGIALNTASGSKNRYRFGSHIEIPNTGLIDFGVRAYSPRLGRFMQPDPAIIQNPEATARLPRGLHLYAFVIGNPVALIDPYGDSIVEWAGELIDKAFNTVINEGAKAIGKTFLKGVNAAWSGIKAAGNAVWGGLKWAAGAAWEGVKWIGKAIAFIGTWGLTIADYMITWINPLNWIALSLDQSDSPLANILSFAIKFIRSPLTTGIGLIIGGVGLITGDVDKVAFKNGSVVFEWDPDSSFSGMTWGGVVHLWGGSVNDPDFEHETWHTYQYVSYGDAFMPTYAVMGGWGALSSLLAGKPQGSCFGGVNDSYTYGQPLEMGGELITPSSNCT